MNDAAQSILDLVARLWDFIWSIVFPQSRRPAPQQHARPQGSFPLLDRFESCDLTGDDAHASGDDAATPASVAVETKSEAAARAPVESQDLESHGPEAAPCAAPAPSVTPTLDAIPNDSSHRGAAVSEWPRCVLVMRHGEREDTVRPDWLDAAQRPWDPPLSAHGVEQCVLRGRELAEGAAAANGDAAPIELVISSPFTRCVQTSAHIMTQLGLPASRLKVLPQMCEWITARNLNLKYAREPPPQLTDCIEDWFWHPHAPEAGVRAAIADAWSPEEADQVEILGQLRLPRLEESQPQAHRRFFAAVREIASSYRGCVLVVTHGDAVGAMVELLQPGSVVYEVNPTGYVRLLQSSPEKDIKFVDGVSVGVLA